MSSQRFARVFELETRATGHSRIRVARLVSAALAWSTRDITTVRSVRRDIIINFSPPPPQRKCKCKIRRRDETDLARDALHGVTLVWRPAVSYRLVMASLETWSCVACRPCARGNRNDLHKSPAVRREVRLERVGHAAPSTGNATGSRRDVISAGPSARHVVGVIAHRRHSGTALVHHSIFSLKA